MAPKLGVLVGVRLRKGPVGVTDGVTEGVLVAVEVPVEVEVEVEVPWR